MESFYCGRILRPISKLNSSKTYICIKSMCTNRCIQTVDFAVEMNMKIGIIKLKERKISLILLPILPFSNILNIFLSLPFLGQIYTYI